MISHHLETWRFFLPYERLLRPLACTDGHVKILTLFCFGRALYFHMLAIILQVYKQGSFIHTYRHAGYARNSAQGTTLNNKGRKWIPNFLVHQQDNSKFLRASPAGLNPIAYIGNPTHFMSSLMAFLLSLSHLNFTCASWDPLDKLLTPKSFFQDWLLRDPTKTKSSFKQSQW